jgi:hypothetical protein
MTGVAWPLLRFMLLMRMHSGGPHGICCYGWVAMHRHHYRYYDPSAYYHSGAGSSSSSSGGSSASSFFLQRRSEERMQSRVEAWRKQQGGCLICGQPVAAPQFSLAVGGRIQVDDEADVLAMDSDGRLLTEECPVRLCLLRYNALAPYHAAHIVDEYTLLPERGFRDDFQKHEAALMQAHPQAMALFKTQVIAGGLYAEGVALGKRMVQTRTVCACARCNMAMKREQAHATAVYRCFSVTRHSHVPGLEGAQAKVTAAKKLLQQIALYFTPVWLDSTTVQTWTLKTDQQLLLDAALWRCIAHLQEWGQSPIGGGVRQRLVAIFHASHYVYLSSSSAMQGRMDWATWHLRVWRPFYTARYRAPTFFGMRQAEVARLFDFAYQEGERWEQTLRARLSAVVDALETQPDEDARLLAAMQLEEAMSGASIADERDMLRFLTRRGAAGGRAAASLDAAWAFFRYALSGGTSSAFLLRQCEALTREMVHVLAALDAVMPPTRAEGPRPRLPPP